MFDIPLRALKDRLTHPISQLIPSTITPNHLTLASFLCGLAACFSAAFPHHSYPYLPVFFWALNRLLDCLDGSVARLRKCASETGGFLDLLSDFIIYSLIPISVAWGLDSKGTDGVGEWQVGKPLAGGDWQAVAVLEATFHVNNFILFYIAALASKKSSKELTSVTMTPALIEGFESGVLFTVMFLRPKWLEGVAWAMSAAVVVGIVQRVVVLLPVLRKVDRGEVGKEEG